MFAEPKKPLKPFVKINRMVLGVEFQMIYLPPGTVTLAHNDAHTWVEKGFLLSAEPVSQALFRVVMFDNPSEHKRLPLPVESVSWLHAVIFCNRLSQVEELAPSYQGYKQTSTQEVQIKWQREKIGYRLPTEPEWEYAAKAGRKLKFAGSDQVDEVAWCAINTPEPQLVRNKQPNAWGFYGMSGGVYEWCWDLNEQDAWSKQKVCRGGSWKQDATRTEISERKLLDLGVSSSEVGFRVACDVPEDWFLK
jgi:formylglycine-generating enzyme required for sulfatase activity